MPFTTMILQGLVMWLILVVAFLIYVLTVNSSGVFTVNRRFLRITGLALGLALLVSAGLYLLLHVNYLLAAVIGLIVACVMHAGVEQNENEEESGAEQNNPLAAPEAEAEEEQWQLTTSFEDEL